MRIKDPWTIKAGGSDWTRQRADVDLVKLATRLLGPAQQRRGGGGRAWWVCPFHEDRNPSLAIRPNDKRWKCFGCGLEGDSVDLVRRLDPALDFAGAVAVILERPTARSFQPKQGAATRPPTIHEPDRETTGLDPDVAAAVARDAAERIVLEDSAEAGRLELNRRGISVYAADAAGVGWVDRLDVPTASGGVMTIRGLCIPWRSRDGHLACLKIRRMDGREPKYIQAFKDPKRWTGIFPTPEWVLPGRPLVITEGELDCLTVASAVNSVGVGVVTLGSASMRLDPGIMAALLPASCWFVATDSDAAGDKAAAAWPASARRIRPPDPFKDWCDAAAGGLPVAAYLSDQLRLVLNP